MTTIIGYRDPMGAAWIGGDTRGHRDGFVVPWQMSKIRRFGEWRLTWAGVACVDTYLEASPKPLMAAETVGDFVLALRGVLSGYGFHDVKPPDAIGSPDYGQEFIVARPGEVWTIEGDGTYAAADPLVIIGNGQDIAYGASEALLRRGIIDGRELILDTLDIAAKFYASTAPPFWVERVK
jgi:ATP-dependent protease HslVU (ClpYQ) peptidase subunit